jgi:hypothetical protein
MIEHVRASLERSFHARGDSPALLQQMQEGLDPNALYLGLARRFAPYKRAHLLFSDPVRLQHILDNPHRPVRIVVSGKAHPRDRLGQDIMKKIVQMSRTPEFAGKILFVEDYDISLARALVQGVDVWVNTPTRMEEASGTSGMKAAANGVLNLSIGDGWWPEAADGQNGWTIGGAQVYEDSELQNQADTTALYGLIEDELVPMYFTRDSRGTPEAWVESMVHCLATVPPQFNTDRMVQEYTDKAYKQLAGNYFFQQAAKKAPARDAGKEVVRIKNAFAQVKIVAANTVELQDFKVGQHLDVTLDVDLGTLLPQDILVELVLEQQDTGEGGSLVVVPMKATGDARGNVHSYAGSHSVDKTGRYAHGMRVRARAPGFESAVRGLVIWA